MSACRGAGEVEREVGQLRAEEQLRGELTRIHHTDHIGGDLAVVRALERTSEISATA